MFFLQKYLTFPVLALLFMLGVIHGAMAQPANLIKAKAVFCKKGLLRPDFCNNKEAPQDALDLILEMIHKTEEETYAKGEIDEDYGMGYFAYDNYMESVKFWSAPPAAFGEDDYKPPHPDSLKKYQREGIQWIKSLYKQKIISDSQQKMVLDAIRANQIIHPYYALNYLAQLTVEDYLFQNQPQLLLEDTLKSKIELELKQRFVKAPHLSRKISLDFQVDSINANQFQQAVQGALQAAYPEAKMLPDPKWERNRLLTRCKIPMRRNVLVFAWDIGEEAPLEIEVNTPEAVPVISSEELILSEVLPEMMLQLEQNRNSQVIGVMRYSPLLARNTLCEQLGIIIQPSLTSTSSKSVTYYTLTDPLYENVWATELPLGQKGKLPLKKQILRRREIGLSTKDKLRLWKKLHESTWMDVYSPEMQRYIWVNLNNFHMRDSFELLRQLGLADYPGAEFFSTIPWINEFYATPPTANGALRWLADLSGNELKPKEYTQFTLEKDKSGSHKWLHFDCNGQPFREYMSDSGNYRLDYLAIEGLASAWNKSHIGEKAFYYIADTQLVLYNTQEKIDKLSGVMHWLIKKM
ncbi:MAG: hypothetical protein H7246_03040 [Phycisphaerae bacterium]|nr:hypothetical protein [Saprospiraceae bacterium]